MLGDEKAGGATLRPYGQRISPLDGDRISKKEKTYLSMVFFLMAGSKGYHPSMGIETLRR
jgi:hypothetical protein